MSDDEVGIDLLGQLPQSRVDLPFLVVDRGSRDLGAMQALFRQRQPIRSHLKPLNQQLELLALDTALEQSRDALDVLELIEEKGV